MLGDATPYTLPYRRGPVLSHSRVANRISKRRSRRRSNYSPASPIVCSDGLIVMTVNRYEIQVSRMAREGERSSSNCQAQGLTSWGNDDRSCHVPRSRIAQDLAEMGATPWKVPVGTGKREAGELAMANFGRRDASLIRVNQISLAEKSES